MKRMGQRITAWVKKELILVLSFLCAAVSCLFVPPSRAYFDYIDWSVLGLLFCLMAVVAGLSASGLFNRMAQVLLSGQKSIRLLCMSLVLLPFFTSMFITNDVALITFVPFAILILSLCEARQTIPYVVVLQTIAANTGSMVLPFGNPQNLFLYASYSFSFWDFFKTVFPFGVCSLVLLMAGVFVIKNQPVSVSVGTSPEPLQKRSLFLFAVLFVLCLLCVLRLFRTDVLVGIMVLCLLIFSRQTFKQIDYSLLVTFIFFFIFSGNMGQIPAVRDLLSSMLSANPMLTAAAASQVISNVPAAVLLSGFTQNGAALLVGTNIGGLGTPIASLASLISFKLYLKSESPDTKRFTGLFFALNVLFLAVMILLSVLTNAI